MYSKTMDQEWDTSVLLMEARIYGGGKGGMEFILQTAVSRSVQKHSLLKYVC